MIRSPRSPFPPPAALALAILAILATLYALPSPSALAAGEPDARTLYARTGVRGGLVVHIALGDGADAPAGSPARVGEFTASLRASDRYLVEGLVARGGFFSDAVRMLQARGLYGQVTLDRLPRRGPLALPYVDDLVNLVVVGCALEDPAAEIVRILAPEGTAVVRRAGNEAWLDALPGPVTGLGEGAAGYVSFVKPRPSDIDEWSHFLRDAGGNAVAEDRRVGPPRGLRWVAGPRWCRSHEIPSSVQAVVTSGGRILTILDEAPAGVYRKLPPRCRLVARDASSGVLLWKRDLREWDAEHGTGTGGRWAIHHTIPRRLIARGDRVWVTLGFLRSPVSVLDAATGETLTEALPGTTGADELLLSGDVLVAKTTKERSVAATIPIAQKDLDDALVAVDVASGSLLWRRDGLHVAPYALSAAAGRVVHHDLAELVCLDARTGEVAWRAPCPATPTVGAGSTLVLHDGVVLYHGRRRPADGRRKQQRFIAAFSLERGEPLWERPGRPSLAAACTQPTDVFVASGIVWCGNSLEGYDLHTGEVRRKLELFELISPGHHYRCHRAKATVEYLIWPKRGAEFIDLDGEDHMRHDWLRAPCFTGATPANGLFYVPPSQCFCYPGAKVSGYLALEARPAIDAWPDVERSVELVARSAAAAGGESLPGPVATAEDWPMHRRDPRRSGSTTTEVPARLRRLWEVRLAAPGTQPVVVGDRMWVAEKDTHSIRCLDASTGEDVWRLTSAGRIDSAPTYHRGRLLHGCRDGTVYCRRADDGSLVWRFHAAPDRRQIVSFGQLESLWPVHGSVLVEDGVVYFAAGRSSFLDGGMAVFALDVRTGRRLHRHVLSGPWPDIRRDVGRPFAMEGALPDLLVSAGERLYMQRLEFDRRLERQATPRESPLGELAMGGDHLVATGGFLDDSGFDRLYWMHGSRWPGFYFSQQAPKSGQLLVHDDRAAYAVKYFYRRVQWTPAFIPGEHGYLLYADDLDNQPTLQEKGQRLQVIDWLPSEAATDKHRRGGRGVEKGTGYIRTRAPRWQRMVPLRIRAMVLAGDRLFVAGTPDEVDPADPLAALEGRRGASLQVVSTEDGAEEATYPLSSVPAFDGLIAARGRLFLTTEDGRLECWGATAP